VEDIFSGERDFFHTFAPEEFDRNELSNGLGKRYEMLRASIKRWPIGGPIQGPMHVMNDLLKQYEFKSTDVAKVIAKMPDKELEIVNNRPMPDISVQHLLAVMMIDRKLTFKTAHDFARMKDKQVLKVREKIHAVGDPSLTDVQRRWRCVMEIHLKNGEVLRGETMAAKGSFENPLKVAEENEKALDLIAPILGKKPSLELLHSIWNIEKIKDDTFYMSKPNYISREEIIGLIKRNSFDNNIRFSILSILKYNINLDAEDVKLFLNKKYLNTFLTPIRNIDAITFDKTIHMFQDLNDLFLIFYEHSNDKKEIKNVTKRVYINLNTKKKTYRK
jgi:hypothetical protein